MDCRESNRETARDGSRIHSFGESPTGSVALAGNAMAPNMLASLGTQAEFLSKSIEHHLLGNHLLANAKAMSFAGIYFTGPESARWLEAGLEILNHELNEQILSDGGALSSAAPCIMQQSFLKTFWMSSTWRSRTQIDAVAIPNRFVWSNYASQTLAWRSAMSHPDGNISFFNDARTESRLTW